VLFSIPILHQLIDTICRGYVCAYSDKIKCPKSGYMMCLLQVSFANAIAPLVELDAQQFPLVQACLLPRMVSPSDDVCRASAEAEKRLDSHFLLCRCIVTYCSYILLVGCSSGSLYVSQTDMHVLLKIIMGNHACWFLA
jgi:hypothetical protein